MHVAILGAGALGVVFGVRLALVGSVDVSFVTRHGGAAGGGRLRIERVDDDGEVLELATPEWSTTIPPQVDVVLVCVRAEQIDAALAAQLRAEAGADVPIVVMTPMMPHTFERLRAELGPRVLAGMPGVVAYRSQPGAFRYWLPRVASTMIDEPRPARADVDELVKRLDAAGITTKLALGVHESNPATTVTFMPLAFALDVAGGVDALLDDHDLLHLALDAAREGGELASRIGKPAAWAHLLVKFVGPHTLKMGIALARMRSAEAVRYVEEHFGHKLHAQNVVMGDAMLELAREKGTPFASMTALVARMKAHGAS